MEATVTRPDLSAVMRVHRKYHGTRITRAYVQALRSTPRRDRMRFKLTRPTMGDRLDGAAERKHWKDVGPAGVEVAKVEAAANERSVKIAKHLVGAQLPYEGSDAQASHRAHGRHRQT